MDNMKLAIGIMLVIVIVSLIFVISPQPTESTMIGPADTAQTQDEEIPFQGIETPRGTVSVVGLFREDVYNEELKLYGKVSDLGMLLCPCFTVSSDGESIEVWYDLMEGMSAVSVDGLYNGDWIIVSGFLQEDGMFYATGIERADKYEVDFSTVDSCQSACEKFNYETGQGMTPAEAEPYFVTIGTYKNIQPTNCKLDAECYCYCYSTPTAPETTDTSSSH